jgi:ergothioneine biosynthesis protein EgtB
MKEAARHSLHNRYLAVRARMPALAAPLSEAECQLQSMPDASPTKWHLAHVTWFFETFVLERFERSFKPHHEAFRVLFNSYYQGVGDQHPRHQRGLVTRPNLAEVLAYRAAVDERVAAIATNELTPKLSELIELGLQHEQQHQELLLTDALHMLSCNPLAPTYIEGSPSPAASAASLQWVQQAGGLVEVGREAGHTGQGFAFDNEGPRHKHWLEPYALANRLTTQGEWLAFIQDGGYRDARWWLSAGWDWVRTQRVEAPLYWRRGESGGWRVFSLHGLQDLRPEVPVAHISLYEADAYARWAAAQHGAPLRLPTEFEWEHAAQPLAEAGVAQGNFVDSGAMQTQAANAEAQGLQQLFGDVWEWTNSAYLPYPGYRPWAGAVGEYNGKFMMNQMVLRGGSCATPRSHIRASYRNFFPPDARWQFTGLRLARDLV